MRTEYVVLEVSRRTWMAAEITCRASTRAACERVAARCRRSNGETALVMTARQHAALEALVQRMRAETADTGPLDAPVAHSLHPAPGIELLVATDGTAAIEIRIHLAWQRFPSLADALAAAGARLTRADHLALLQSPHAAVRLAAISLTGARRSR